jgi:hypothetical protein
MGKGRLSLNHTTVGSTGKLMLDWIPIVDAVYTVKYSLDHLDIRRLSAEIYRTLSFTFPFTFAFSLHPVSSSTNHRLAFHFYQCSDKSLTNISNANIIF